MIVQFILTVRCTPESKADAINTFAAHYRHFRETVEQQVAEGKDLQLPPTTQVRWVLNSGRWE